MNRRGSVIVLLVVSMAMLAVAFACWLNMGQVYAAHALAVRAADAAALAGASGLIEGREDSVRARAARIAQANRAALDSLHIDTQRGVVQVWASVPSGALLLVPTFRVRAYAAAGASAPRPQESGRPIPKGNAFGWWKQQKQGGHDSAVVRLTQ